MAYPHDTTPDSNSGAGIGAWSNKLKADSSLAISRYVEAAFAKAGIAPKGRVEIMLKGGAVLALTWDDRTARSYKGKALVGRFDLYCSVTESHLNGTAVIGFRKV